MKKNFLKKLSFVMALAMIVSLVAPAAGAFAATKPALNASSKTLLLGTTDRNGYDFNVKNKVSGSTYAWSSDNEAVATVDETGLTTAAGVGTTKVTVVITKKDGKTVTLSATVVVKDNIKDITEVYLQTKDAAVDKLAANTDYDFGRKFVTASGSTTKTTSVTRWFVDSDKATVDKNGLFKATEAGTYKVTAVAFQSTAKYDAWAALKDTTSTVNVLATKTVEVKVVNSFKVEQLSATEAKVTFNSPMASVNASDVTVSSLVAATSTKIKQSVKSVVLSTDKKSATITMYTTFDADKTYIVDFTGMESQQFVGAKADVANVVDMVISTSTMAIDKDYKIEVKLLDKNGVDLASIDSNLLNRVTYTSSSVKVYASGNTLRFYNVGDTTDVTAVFHTYKYDTTTGVETGAITKKATIAGVAVSSATVGSMAAYTMTSGTPDFAKTNTVIAAEDKNFKFYVKAVKTDGTTTSYVCNNDSAATLGKQAFKFDSSDKNVLIVTADGTLYPVKNGQATVIVYYTADNTVTNPTWTVIGSPTVTVSAKRVATTVKLGANAFSLSNTTNYVDSKDVTVEVLDQYGNNLDLENVSLVESNNNYTGTHLLTSIANDSATKKTITFSGSVGSTAVTDGTYYYTLKANGIQNYISATVNKPTDNTVKTYKLVLDKTAYDTKITDTDLTEIAKLQVIGYAANGVAVQRYTNSDLAAAKLTVKAYLPDGTVSGAILTNGTGNDAYTVTLADATGSASGAAIKLATGNYSFRLYLDNNQYVDGTNFTLSDTQVAPTLTVNKNYAEEGKGYTSLLAAVKDCVTVKDKDNKDIKDLITLGDVVGPDAAGSTALVKTVKYREYYNNGGSYVEFTINVGQMITTATK